MNYMKSIKILTVTISLMLAFITTACAGNKEANPNEWKFEGSRPAIIDFYATWCGPCKAMAPILDSISKDYAGKIDVYKIDVDKESELAGAFGIQSIPTLLMIPAKGEPKILQGAMPKDQLTKIVNEFLLEKK